MSEQPKKARDIKDLKARLGRGPAAGPESGAPGPGPGAPGAFPQGGMPVPSGMPAPAGMPGPAGMPAPFAARGGAPAGLPPSDPFAPPPAKSLSPGMAPAMRGSRPPPGLGAPPPAAPPPSADPFAAAPVAPAQEVRLIIDEKAVSDDEVGRKSSSKLMIGLVAAALVGIAIGWMIGSTVRERSMFNLALQDAKDIYGTATTAAPTVEKVQKLLDQAVRSAGGAPPTIDTKALEELRKLEKPFPADVFARKFYRAFEPATVDSLFTYYNNVNMLWAKLQSLTGRGLNPNTRAQLETAAKAAGLEYGCVPFAEGDKPWGCGLVTLTSIEEAKAKVTLRGASYDKTVFAGQDVKGKASDYVIPVDRARSGEVLGGATSLFQSYARELIEAKTLADQTTEIQGRLIQQLGTIAKLESI